MNYSLTYSKYIIDQYYITASYNDTGICFICIRHLSALHLAAKHGFRRNLHRVFSIQKHLGCQKKFANELCKCISQINIFDCDWNFIEIYSYESSWQKVIPGSGNSVVLSKRQGPFARYVKLRVAHASWMPETFSPPPRISDPDVHHDTCVTYVPWCMPGSLTSGFLWNRWRGKRSRRMRNPQLYVSGKRPNVLSVPVMNPKALRVPVMNDFSKAYIDGLVQYCSNSRARCAYLNLIGCEGVPFVNRIGPKHDIYCIPRIQLSMNNALNNFTIPILDWYSFCFWRTVIQCCFWLSIICLSIINLRWQFYTHRSSPYSTMKPVTMFIRYSGL